MSEFYQFITERANKTLLWSPSDTEENYKKITRFGPNLYNPGDFTYIFNSYGFRSDEFDLPSDIPIVFIGCSSTEGTGLPLEEVWSYKLITKIRNATNKNIPFWNLSAGGIGIDTIARHLYWFTKTRNVKYIFGYFPEFSRREYKLSNSDPQLWAASYKTGPRVDNIFSDDNFINHQSERSLMIIDLIRQYNNAITYTSKWGQTEKIIDNFSNLNFFTSKFKMIDVARDNIHLGPKYHSVLANLYWSKCKHHFT